MIRGTPLVYPAPERLRPRLDHHLAARRLLRSQIVTTFSNLPTRVDHLLLERKSAFKNTLLRSNVPSAPKSSLVHTISARIFALTRTSDRSYVPFVVKLLLVNTIARDTRVCTVERRSLFVAVSLAQAAAGDAGEDLLVRTLSAGISEAKREEFASSHC